MHRLVSAVCLSLVLTLPSFANAGVAEDFHAAREKWKSAGISSYSFHYEWHGAVVVAPDCAGAEILVMVRNGVSSIPRVIHGSDRCPRGTRGEKAIGFSVPRSMEALFEEMARYIDEPPVHVKVTAHFNPTTGVPTDFWVERLDFYDDDDGFKTSHFTVLK